MTGTYRDRAHALPFDWRPNALYVVEDLDAEQLQETLDADGEPAVRHDFIVSAIYVAANEGENANAGRSRDVSIALDAKRTAYFRLLHEFRTSGDEWGHVQATADADYTRQLEVRGIALRISGWRFVR